MRIDGQVGGLPRDLVDRLALFTCLTLEILEALLDGILMRSREGRVDEVTGIGLTGVHRDPCAVFDGAAHLIDAGEVDHRIDALRVQVQGERDEVDVARAFAVAEETTFDAIGAGHLAEFGGGDGRAAVVVWVQRYGDELAILDVA